MRKFLLISVVAFGFLYSWTGWSAERAAVRGSEVRGALRAAETFVTIDKTRDLKTYRVLYPELSLFVVDEYQQNGENFQQRISQKKFISEAVAREYLAQFPAVLVSDTVSNVVNDPGTDAVRETGGEMPITESEDEVLWIAENEWNLDWEQKYAAWVAEKVDAIFHKRFGIATDCADVAIATRWIFARINKLPMANTLAGSKRLFTNETVLQAWVKLPTAVQWYDDRRFFAGLNYLLDNTYTHSLIADSYPIAISPDYFTAGVHHLNLYSENSGHTRFVGLIDAELGGVQLLASTVPRELRTLSVDMLFDSGGIKKLSDGGFLKIRWAEYLDGKWALRAKDQMPGYSMEQYARNFADGDRDVYRIILDRLGIEYNPVRQIQTVIEMLRARLDARVQIVKDGYQFCQLNNCAPGSSGYEAWSTPHRDLAISTLAVFLFDIGYENAQTERLLEEFVLSEWLVEGRRVEYDELLRNFYDEEVSSDPRDTLLKRWALE